MRVPAASVPVLLALSALAVRGTAGEVLVARGAESTWRYLDSAAAPDRAWTAADFADGSWKSGPAPLGYGDTGLGTTVGFGGDPRRKPLTVWFRKSFEVKSTDGLASVGLALRCDDGAVVYVNGKEAARRNLPEEAISGDTPAEEALSETEEIEVHRFILPKETVKTGANVIAVEVHQASASSSDLYLDLELKALEAGEVPKTDYLAEGRALLRKGDLRGAARQLEQVPPDASQYGKTMLLLAQEIYPRLGDTEKALAAMDKAYAAAPGDMETAYTWVRAHVEARHGLAEKVLPRPLPEDIPAEWRFISDGPKWPDNTDKLPRAKLLEDCDYLEEMIANCYSYADRRGADWRTALDALRAGLAEETGRDTFLFRLNRFMTVFGDPHSAFRDRLNGPTGRLEVIFTSEGDRLLAVKNDRSGFVRKDCPYVSAIDGVPVAEWLRAAADSVPRASPQYQKRLTAAALSGIEELGWQTGHKTGPECILTLESADGKTTAEEKVPVRRNRRGAGRREWPDTKTKLIGSIGYLRIPEMESGSDFIGSLNSRMKEFKDTTGLIIDVRGNGGGTQDAIKTLLPYFMKPTDPLKVINVAAYRLPLALPKPNPEGFLGLYGRGLYPASSEVWSDDDRSRIADFMKTWQPKWKLPEGKFSDWHFMAVRPSTNPEAYAYTAPVVVLQDAGCFSATDNFLGALKGHPGVTLLGTASGGGSGRMAGYELPNAGSTFTLCQMASFATTGATYDGIGVSPDVVMPSVPEDALLDGGDSQLEAALKRLQGQP